LPSSSLPFDEHRPAPFLLLHYADRLDVSEHVLGVVGFGGSRPEGLGADIPFIQAPLSPLTGGAAYEIWQADAPVKPLRVGPVQGAYNEALAFGAVRIEEAGLSLEDATERAYEVLFEFLDRTSCTEPIRFWNYLGNILHEADGLERYRRFNIGRHKSFLRHLRQAVPPAASGVGGHGDSVIYVLAAREAARAVENPRQVSAYEYPPQYGPRSPGFSRAGLFGGTLFVSGTASIVGHETRHEGDAAAQAAETAANLRALIRAAGLENSLGRGEGWALKAYLREAADRDVLAPVLADLFGAGAEILYLHGEICRADLALEVEAFYRGA
jgi:chorismate lyase / 3-hydroxybenzoate synthase